MKKLQKNWQQNSRKLAVQKVLIGHRIKNALNNTRGEGYLDTVVFS